MVMLLTIQSSSKGKCVILGVGVVLKVGNLPNPLSIAEGDWVIPGSANLGTWRGYLVGWNQDFIPVGFINC